MFFVAICMDKPGHLQTRLDNRPAHLDFIESHRTVIKFGGPFLGPDEKPIGSMLIVDCTDEASARALLANDPYAKAGLFGSVEVTPWRQVVGPSIA